jgi:hypothetical protein
MTLVIFGGGWNTSKWFTPCSGFRCAIPHFCNFEGRAIYTDVDMINCHDISELYTIDMNGKPFAACKGNRWGYEFCVMVIDCKKAKEYIWDIKKLKRNSSSHSFHRNNIANSNDLVHTQIQDGIVLAESLSRFRRSINYILLIWYAAMEAFMVKGTCEDHPRKNIIAKYLSLEEECNLKKIPLSDLPKGKIDFKILL